MIPEFFSVISIFPRGRKPGFMWQRMMYFMEKCGCRGVAAADFDGPFD
jgi:hypothetical protein